MPKSSPADDLPLAMAVLDLFASEEPILLIYPPDLEPKLGCNRSAAYRVCEQMEAAGWLTRCNGLSSKAYRLGPKAERLGAARINGAMREHDLLLEALAGMRDALVQADRLRRRNEQDREALDQRIAMTPTNQENAA